jgi:acyl carrier protein
MTKEDVLAKLTSVFRDVFDDESLTITAETTANDIEDWDSLSHIDLIAAIEKHFDVKFTTREITDLKNVGDFTSVLAQKVS